MRDDAARLARLAAEEADAWAEVERHPLLTPERTEAFGRWFRLKMEREDIEEATADGADPAEVDPVPPEVVTPALIWARRQRREHRNQVTTVDEHGAEPLTPESLRRTVRRLTGRAGGRPPELTTITDDEQLRVHVRAMRRDRVRITRESLAARSGFTVAEVRGYLRVTGRSWAEFLSSF